MARVLNKPLPTDLPQYRVFTGLQSRANSVIVGSKSGVTVDSYRQKIKNGQFAASNYLMNALRVDRSEPMNAVHNGFFIQTLENPSRRPIGTLVKQSYTGYLNALPGNFNGYSHLATVSSENRAKALAKLHNKVKAEYEGFNSLIFLGELGETLRMFRNPAKALLDNTGRFLDTLKSTRQEVRSRIHPRRSDTPASLRRRRLQAVRDGMSGTWLEYSFGLSPLMSDVKDIAETAARALVGKDERSRVSTFSNAMPVSLVEPPFTTAPIPSDSSARFTAWTSKESNAGIRYVAHLSKHRTGPVTSLNEVAILSGFNIRNFIPTLYELMPYSFLIDYFLNIGDIISAACTDTSSVYSFCTVERQVTTFQFIERYFPATPQPITPGTMLTLGLSGNLISRRNLTRTTLTRTASTSVPLPQLVFTVPGADSSKWINMAALLAQSKAFRF